jgi:hypothetical protein
MISPRENNEDLQASLEEACALISSLDDEEKRKSVMFKTLLRTLLNVELKFRAAMIILSPDATAGAYGDHNYGETENGVYKILERLNGYVDLYVEKVSILQEEVTNSRKEIGWKSSDIENRERELSEAKTLCNQLKLREVELLSSSKEIKSENKLLKGVILKVFDVLDNFKDDFGFDENCIEDGKFSCKGLAKLRRIKAKKLASNNLLSATSIMTVLDANTSSKEVVSVNLREGIVWRSIKYVKPIVLNMIWCLTLAVPFRVLLLVEFACSLCRNLKLLR